MMFKNVLNDVDRHAVLERGRHLPIQLFRRFARAGMNRLCIRGLGLHRSVGSVSHRGFKESIRNTGHQQRWISSPAASSTSQQAGLRFEALIEDVSLDGTFEELIAKGKPSTASCQAKRAGLSRLGLDPAIPFPEGYALSASWQKALG